MIPKYSINLLHSASRWLAGKSGTIWAIECGHQSLMNTYAKDLTELAAHLQGQTPICKGCGGLVNAPLGRDPDPLDCQCVKTDKVLDVSEQHVRDLGVMIRRLVNKVHRIDAHDPICHQALDLLERKGHTTSPLRNE